MMITNTYLTPETIALFGVLVGYTLGFFLSNKQEIHIEIPKQDIELMNEEINSEETYNDAYKKYVKKINEHSVTSDDIISLLDKSGMILYRVIVPFFITAKSYEEAFTKAFKSIKLKKNGLIKGGAVDAPGTYAEEMDAESLEELFNPQPEVEEEVESDIDWEDFVESPQYEKYHKLVMRFQKNIAKIKEEYLSSKDETN